jgi:hypothetical protein
VRSGWANRSREAPRRRSQLPPRSTIALCPRAPAPRAESHREHRRARGRRLPSPAPVRARSPPRGPPPKPRASTGRGPAMKSCRGLRGKPGAARPSAAAHAATAADPRTPGMVAAPKGDRPEPRTGAWKGGELGPSDTVALPARARPPPLSMPVVRVERKAGLRVPNMPTPARREPRRALRKSRLRSPCPTSPQLRPRSCTRRRPSPEGKAPRPPPRSPDRLPPPLSQSRARRPAGVESDTRRRGARGLARRKRGGRPSSQRRVNSRRGQIAHATSRLRQNSVANPICSAPPVVTEPSANAPTSTAPCDQCVPIRGDTQVRILATIGQFNHRNPARTSGYRTSTCSRTAGVARRG